MICRITDYMRIEWITPSLKANDKPELLREFASLFCASHPELNREEIYSKLLEREQKASTGADHGVAIPHATLSSSEGLMVAFGKSQKGIPFSALDNEDSKLFFVVLAPAKTNPHQTTYLQVISAICRLMRSSSLRERLLQAQSEQSILETLKYGEEARIASPTPSMVP